MKRCGGCRRELPVTIEYFSANSGTKDGFQTRCRACHKASSLKYRLQHKARNEALSDMPDHDRWPEAVEGLCSRCRVKKPRTPRFFHRSKHTRDGLRVECKACHTTDVIANTDRDAAAAYKRVNVVSLGEKSKRYRAARWARTILFNSIAACGRRGFSPPEFDEDFILDLFERQGGKCHWYGVSMVPNPGHRDPQRPSLDRLDNSRGYHRDNVVLCCAAANIGRSSASAERFAEFCATLKASMKDTSK